MVSRATLQRRALRPSLESIHRYMERGDRMDAVDAMRRYVVADFFVDYHGYLKSEGIGLEAYVDAVKAYHTIRSTSGKRYLKKRLNVPTLDEVFDFFDKGQDAEAVDGIRRYRVLTFFQKYATWLQCHQLSLEHYVRAVVAYHLARSVLTSGRDGKRKRT